MRLNRGTIVLVVVGLIVIVGVLLINNQRDNNPAATPTAGTPTGGPLFTGLTTDSLVRFEVRDNTTGERTILTRGADDIWNVSETSAPLSNEVATPEPLDPFLLGTEEATDEATQEAATAEATEVATGSPALDQSVVATDLGSFVGLTASDNFDSDELESFGLDQPAYSILATSEDGTVYVLHIGGQNPSGNRYYTTREEISASGETLGATDEPQAVATVITDSGDNTLGDGSATEAATDEATQEAADETPVTSADETAEATPTPDMLVDLSGSRTIYPVQKSTVDTLIGLLTALPFPVPTETPFILPTEATLEATPEATEAPTEAETEEAVVEETEVATEEEAVPTQTRRPTATEAETEEPTVRPTRTSRPTATEAETETATTRPSRTPRATATETPNS